MFFFKLSNANILFSDKTLIWKSHIANKTLLIVMQILIIDPKKVIIAILNIDSKIFIIYIAI